MKSESIEIKYERLSFEELNDKEKELIESAKNATYSAYSPYSSFSVGAAVRLENDEIIIGSNQENIAYPSGLCAERVALFSAGTRKEKITALALAARNSKNEWTKAFPCGACCQVLQESQQRASNKITILILLDEKEVLRLKGTESLLPFGFSF
ncbi:MAG: cytidine deaminase [Bacteroidales bacterium]|nr:cytidine deaminase [Bacteroidales bacterium]